MKKVIILKGLPGSGKSTWARKMVDDHPGEYKRVNKDDLRDMLDNGRQGKGNEQFILHIRDSIILTALQEGKSVIVDDTNLNPIHEKHIRDMVGDSAQIEIKVFSTTVEECVARDKARGEKSVGEKVIRGMFNRYMRNNDVSETLPDAIIVDIDGTLAKMADRSPYEWERVGEDELHYHIADLINKYSSFGVKILIVTGRDGSSQELTKQWLSKHKIHWDKFFIRPAKNREKDTVIKKRIFEQEIRQKYHVLFVLDDRQQVVDMWRSLGLPCFQVAEGDF